MLKPNAITVYNYVKENEGANITLNDIAEGTGLSSKSVNGIIVSNFQKVGLMERVGANKFIKLTDAGRNFDPTATPAVEA